MALKNTINRLLQTYGMQATLRTYTTTENEYGEVVNSSNTERFIYLLFLDNITDSRLREIIGIIPKGTQSFLISSDEVISDDDTIIFDNKEYQVNEVQNIYFKGNVVCRIVLVS